MPFPLSELDLVVRTTWSDLLEVRPALWFAIPSTYMATLAGALQDVFYVRGSNATIDLPDAK